MAWKAYLRSDAALARTLGVHRRAVQVAELRGKILREPDGRWDAFFALERAVLHARDAPAIADRVLTVARSGVSVNAIHLG